MTDDNALFGNDTPVITEAGIAEKSGAELVADSLGRSTVQHDRMRNRTLWIIAGCALGLALIIGGMALNRGRATQEKTAAETPPTGSALLAAGARPASADSTALAMPASTDPASGAPVARPGGSVSETAAPVPVTPSASGAQLPELSSLPAGTIAMVVVPKGFQGATYRVAFRPFGWGSGGAAGGRLVVAVDSSQPSDAGAKSLGRDLVKGNLTVWCTPECSPKINGSGSYSGILEVRSQADVGVFYLTEAVRK